MSPNDQIDHFAGELDKLVERFRAEFDLTYAAIIGVLHIKAHMLISKAMGNEE